MIDLAGNEIAHFAFRVKGLSDRSELSVHYAEDLPGAAAHRCGRQASGVKQEACAVASGDRSDTHRAGLGELAVFDRVRKLFVMQNRSGGVAFGCGACLQPPEKATYRRKTAETLRIENIVREPRNDVALLFILRGMRHPRHKHARKRNGRVTMPSTFTSADGEERPNIF